MGMLATETAASIRKAQLYENFGNMFKNTVESLATAIEAKDSYTYGHSRRVARISAAICKELGMAKKETKLVELAAYLHDIGKIGTPESILNKPGALLADEFEKIKEHPAMGAAILSNIDEFSEIVKWIRHHHEWYDGKGYPDRISADDIPIEARIMKIADAYDAITSDRPYRKGMPTADAMKIMEESTRRQFDPEIFQVFRRLLHEGKIEPY
jgi:putative nucleotidyltransferase with HDIG domain